MTRPVLATGNWPRANVQRASSDPALTLPANTATPIPWTVAVQDQWGMLDSSVPERITVPVGGLYVAHLMYRVGGATTIRAQLSVAGFNTIHLDDTPVIANQFVSRSFPFEAGTGVQGRVATLLTALGSASTCIQAAMIVYRQGI